jgi:hypothetical protein
VLPYPEEELVGTYKDSSGKQHGFLQLAGGSVPITIDYPNAVTTIAMGLNPEGTIVGQYTDTCGDHSPRKSNSRGR